MANDVFMIVMPIDNSNWWYYGIEVKIKQQPRSASPEAGGCGGPNIGAYSIKDRALSSPSPSANLVGI